MNYIPKKIRITPYAFFRNFLFSLQFYDIKFLADVLENNKEERLNIYASAPIPFQASVQ